MVYGNIEETWIESTPDPSQNCPTCGSDIGYSFHECEDAETGYYENWLECKACGAKTDDDELIRIRREVTA